MRALVRPSLVLFGLLTALCGAAYPAAVTGLAQLFFPEEAQGSILSRDGRPVGSSLIGQPFADPGLFWGRPSATSPAYNAAASSGSNLGPHSPALAEAISARVEALGAGPGEIPGDLLTASGSGLDPHISPEAAAWQIPRIAAARGLPAERLQALVDAHSTPRALGVLGEPVVNVLALNLELAQIPPWPSGVSSRQVIQPASGSVLEPGALSQPK